MSFSLDNYYRNASVSPKLKSSLKATSTGTTIVGVTYANGVVLAADTRATNGSIVADKNCEKIHYIAPNIWCCGAGTAADTEAVTRMISSAMTLARLEQQTAYSRVPAAVTQAKRHLHNYQGYIGAYLIMAGYDPVDGPCLYGIHAHGSTDRLPFTALGSGSLAAMAVLERHLGNTAMLPRNLSRQQASQLAIEAIKAGILNDLGSGSNVDLMIIERDESVPATMLGAASFATITAQLNRSVYQSVGEAEAVAASSKSYRYQKGSTEIIGTVETRPVRKAQADTYGGCLDGRAIGLTSLDLLINSQRQKQQQQSNAMETI